MIKQEIASRNYMLCCIVCSSYCRGGYAISLYLDIRKYIHIRFKEWDIKHIWGQNDFWFSAPLNFAVYKILFKSWQIIQVFNIRTIWVGTEILTAVFTSNYIKPIKTTIPCH